MKKYIIYGVILFLIIGFWTNKYCNDDKKIIKLSADAAAKDTTILEQEKAMEALRAGLKAKDGELLVLKGTDKEKELLVKKANDKMLNIRGQVKGLIFKLNNRVLKSKYNELIIDHNAEKSKYEEQIESKNNIILKHTDIKADYKKLDQQFKDYQKTNNKLKATLRKQVLLYAKKSEKRLHLGTLNFNVVSMSADGQEYFSIGIGGSYKLFQKKYSPLEILKTINKIK